MKEIFEKSSNENQIKIAVMQPYLLPYIGYFQLINAVDKFVIYDDVNYIKGGWINRNRYIVNKVPHLITLNLKNQSSFRLINEIEIGDNSKKILKTIDLSYHKAPYFETIFPLVQDIFLYSEKNLTKFITNSIQCILRILEIDTDIILSSTFSAVKDLKRSDRLFFLCKNLEARIYINSIGGRDIYTKEEFSKKGIQLFFLKTHEIKYNQFNSNFFPGLSIIDVMMFNPIKDIMTMLNQYELV